VDAMIALFTDLNKKQAIFVLIWKSIGNKSVNYAYYQAEQLCKDWFWGCGVCY
jgi:hypothetical protein